VRRFYQLAIWAPILVPALVWVGVRAFGYPRWEPIGGVIVILTISLRFGAVPYALLAAWGTWHVRELPESSIRRLALRAPLLMLAVFLPVALALGPAGGDPWGGVKLFLAGAVFILILGYAYVGVVFLARWSWTRYAPRGRLPSST
jgi:hypothetical protein